MTSARCSRRSFTSCSRRACGTRQIDPHVAESLQPQSTGQYRKGLLVFLAFLSFYALHPRTVEEFDDLLVEWKNDNICAAPPSQTLFRNAIAGLEKAYPRFKDQLILSKQIANAWKVCVRPSHTVPISRPWVMLLGCHLSQRGMGRLGACLILQYLQCCRPSEILGLRGGSILTALEYLEHGFGADDGIPRGVLFLGQKAGTKSGRPQASIVSNHIALRLLQHFRATTAFGSMLSSHSSLSSYNKYIGVAAKHFGLDQVGWTAHSPRAGYASDAAILGLDFTTVREHGRWVSDKSLRGYMDVMSVMGGELALQLRPYIHLVGDIEANFDKYFKWW
jgi:hypothetical protein